MTLIISADWMCRLGLCCLIISTSGKKRLLFIILLVGLISCETCWSSRYNFTFKEIVILDLSANLSSQKLKYDFETPDQGYFNQTYRGELNLSFLKKYAYNTSFDYLIYTSTTSDFRETIPFWNMSISRFVLKNNAGEIKVGVNNLLDQSNNVTQSAGENFVQQQTMNTLGRFYMVSFTYALNKHLNPMGGRRGGPGMIRIMR